MFALVAFPPNPVLPVWAGAVTLWSHDDFVGILVAFLPNGETPIRHESYDVVIEESHSGLVLNLNDLRLLLFALH